MLATLSVVGQNTVRFYGRVSDEFNHGLEAVYVMVDGTHYGTQTDSVGRYSLEFVSDEPTAKLNFELFGYCNVSTVQKVKEGGRRVNVTMKDSITTIAGGSITEVGRQTSNVSLLPVDKLKETPNVGGGVEGLISTQAGVHVNNELSSQYSVRGGNFDENCVYVNHIEVYRPFLVRSGEQEGLSFVNPDLVEKLSFSTGGFSVEYGDKMSSVLDIMYKKPEAFEGSASVSLLGGSAYIGAKNGKFTQIHGARYKSNEMLLGSLDTKGEYKPRFFDYQTYLTYTFSPKWEASFLGNISRNSYKFVPESRSTSFGTLADTKSFTVYFDGQEKDLFQTYFLNFALKFNPNKNLELKFTAADYIAKENVAYDIEGEYWLSDVDGTNSTTTNIGHGVASYLQHARDDLDAKVQNYSLLGKYKQSQNELKWGATYQNERISYKDNEWEMRDSAGYSMPFDPSNYRVYYHYNSKNDWLCNRVMLYVMDSYTFYPTVGRMVLTGGVRGNFGSYTDKFLVSPRASLAFFPEKNQNWGFRLASGVYYQSLFCREFKNVVYDELGEGGDFSGHHSLLAPRSFQLICGSDYYFRAWNRPFKFTSELYGKYIDHLISYSVDNVRIVYSGKNDGDGYVVGADFKLFGEFIPGTDSWISLSLMNAKENIYGDGVGYISRPSEQRYNISMFFQDYLPGNEKLRMNIRLNWADGVPFGPPHAERKYAVFRTPSYRRVDIGGSYVLKRTNSKLMQKRPFSYLKTLSLGADVLNLFDINNVNSYYWVTDVNNQQYAVPNYLTGRQLNVKLSADF